MLLKKKKNYMVLITMILVMLYSIPCHAEDERAILNNNVIQENSDMKMPFWTSILTTSGTIVIPADTYVPGASSYYVRLLQATLNAIGYNCGTADGVYGTNTRNAIIRFQNAHGLTADGIAGKETWLDVAAEAYNAGIKVPF